MLRSLHQQAFQILQALPDMGDVDEKQADTDAVMALKRYLPMLPHMQPAQGIFAY